ncbi:MAG: DNA primase [Clostridia bacterium]|nr:DNA primase [Clostridia bacterium]
MQNKGFPTDWLSELKQKNNIVSVIGKTIRLERKGNKFWACCPFHHEKTPSFTVSEDEGYFYCFGCKEHGDVIAYVQKFESCDFQEAISILAKNAGMEVPQYQGTQENTQKKQLKERVLKLLDETYKHYQANLYTKEAKPAQDYIKQRGFTRRELEDFKLGYSLNWTDLIGHLRKHGFTYNEMLEAGVVQAKEKENGKTTYYDVMAGRLCFPIFNAFNECVGFSARALEKTDYAKYKNTAETVVFQKGRVVFGINLVKALKQSGNLDKVIIVEGQIDVIAMHRAGFKSTVACMGTALTKENAKELKKLSNKVVLCFDGDTAGIKATIKSIEILKEEGFDIRIAQMPDGHDPDEILRLQGKQALEEIINKALPPTDYLIENELKKYNLSHADEKGKFTQSALDIIAKLDSSSMEEPYLEKIRDITNVPIDILRRDIAKIKKGITPAKLPEKEGQNVLVSRENGNNRAVKYVLGSLVFKKPFVRREIDYKKLLPRFADVIDKALAGIPISSYYDYFDVENMPTLKDCLAIDFDLYKNNAQVYFDECIRLIASQELSKRQEELTKQFTECRVQEERLEIMKKLNAVNKALREKSLEEFYVR